MSIDICMDPACLSDTPHPRHSFFASAAPPHPDNIAFNRVKSSTPLHHPDADKQPTMLDMIANLTARVEALEKALEKVGV